MLSAHFAPALVAKAVHPALNLPAAAACCILIDLLHALLAAVGRERLRMDERYSHTFLTSFVLAAIVFIVAILLHAGLVSALIYAMCVISHPLLDLINRRQMALSPWGGRVPGLGLHRPGYTLGHRLSFALELSLVIGSVLVYGWSAFDGTLRSLLVPVIVLVAMLAGEFGYFRIYAPLIEGHPAWRDEAGR